MVITDVIAATADPIKNSAISLAPHGIDGMLVKPFRTSELEEIIRRLGAKKTEFRPRSALEHSQLKKCLTLTKHHWHIYC
jgi:DNA-binding NarL/FixJ family response regulator